MIFGKTIDQHIEHVCKVLPLLYDPEVTLKLEKCNFLTYTIDNLNHVILSRHLELVSHTTYAIRGFSFSTSVTELKSFLGLCSFNRQLLHNFMPVASPLNQQLKKPRQNELHRLTAKQFMPCRHGRTLWSQLQCWHFHILVDKWRSTHTRAMLKLAAS